MKIYMQPGKADAGDKTSGISVVVHKYIEYLEKNHKVEFVDNPEEADLTIGHAGAMQSDVVVLHGLYWTGDYDASEDEYKTNANIVKAVRGAKEITVPSAWVQKTLQRDMHITPTVIPHGIEWSEWQHNYKSEGYVLWNKNRPTDVCSPKAVVELAKRAPAQKFVTTFGNRSLENMEVIGAQPANKMKEIVQKAGVYLSLVKETFGIGVLEAMAAGVPVLGWDYGGNQDLVVHGVTGYLAEPDNYEDLVQGLEYCIEHRERLGAAARELAKLRTWDEPVKALYEVMKRALKKKTIKKDVSVIIPLYNYAANVEKAVESVCAQTLKPKEIIIVNDGSTDNPRPIIEKLIEKHPKQNIIYVEKENGGVASARNLGVQKSTGDYICCLDADDRIAPDFLRTCANYLEDNPSVYTAYTRLLAVTPDGKSEVSPFPSEYKYDLFLRRYNQVPTCNVSRREVWTRTGGQRSRFCPNGAGSEDAELWLRAGSLGMGGALVTQEPLFIYSNLTGLVSGNKEYQEVDWVKPHAWAMDKKHPFASYATSKHISHKVYQYDRPKISIIIPCATSHLKYLQNALDSIEAQTFRDWEVIVVYDGEEEVSQNLKDANPYVEWLSTGKSGSGAAVARNLGVKKAKAPALFFLDADDYLLMSALEKMYAVYDGNDVVYSDYLYLKKEKDLQSAKLNNTSWFLQYNPKTQQALCTGTALEYDCERAQRQPEDPTYDWATVSVLMPKALFDELGGFDEKLKIIEDVDLHWRMAHKGICYTYIEEPLLVINLNSGLHKYEKANNKKALEYIKDKYKGQIMTPCGGCGNKAQTHPTIRQSYSVSRILEMNDEDFVMVDYTSKNIGTHTVVGAASKIDYGYRQGGDRFLVHKSDIKVSPHLFKPIEPVQKAKPKPEVPAPVAETKKEKDA